MTAAYFVLIIQTFVNKHTVCTLYNEEANLVHNPIQIIYTYYQKDKQKNIDI